MNHFEGNGLKKEQKGTKDCWTEKNQLSLHQQGAVVQRIECLAMKTELIGSNPSHNEVVFSIGFFSSSSFFFFFIFFTILLFSRHCMPCGPSLRINPTVGSAPSHEKTTEINLSLREKISMKKPQQCHLWGQNRDISLMFGANKKPSLTQQT